MQVAEYTSYGLYLDGRQQVVPLRDGHRFIVIIGYVLGCWNEVRLSDLLHSCLVLVDIAFVGREVAVDADVVVACLVVLLRLHEQRPLAFHVRHDIVVFPEAVRLQLSVDDFTLLVVHGGSDLHIVGRELLPFRLHLSEQVELVLYRLLPLELSDSSHLHEVVPSPSLHH